MTYTQLLNLTSNMSEDELCKLNSDLVAIIKHRRKMSAKDMGSQLSPGDTVKLTERSGRVRTGTVQKVMRTRALVKIDGVNYKVPMSMLSFA